MLLHFSFSRSYLYALGHTTPHCVNIDSIFLLLSKLHFSSAKMTNVVEVKVGLHCDECIKKILKAVKKIQDIETYDVDTQLNKVIVTGNVTTEEVIRVIQKMGKTASAWEGEEISC